MATVAQGPTTALKEVVFVKAKKYIMGLVAALLAVVGLTTASTALATSTADPPSKVVDSKLTATVVGAKASGSDIVTGKVTVLAYGQAYGLTKAQIRKASRCYTVDEGTPFVNSGKNANGKWLYFSDVTKQKQNRFCDFGKGKAKVTIKVNCGNRAFVKRVPPGVKLVTGRVLLVRSFASVKIKLTASVKVAVSCDTGFSKASASAWGYASVTISLRQYIKAHGNAVNGIYTDATAEATAKASVQAECSVPPPVPPPPVQPPPPPPSPPPAPPPSPPPAPPPSPSVTYSAWCDGARTENKSNVEIRWTGGWTASTGQTQQTVSTTISYAGQYNTSVSYTMTINFPNGKSQSCTATAKTGPPPFQP